MNQHPSSLPRAFRVTLLVLWVLSLALIVAAIVLYVMYGQIADAGAFVSCPESTTFGTIAGCLYPPDYMLSKVVAAFAPGAFTAGLIGIFLGLLLRGIGWLLSAGTSPAQHETPADSDAGPINLDRFRRPV